METKQCCRCRETKPVAAFNKDRTIKDGLSANCRECRSVYAKQWFKREGKDRRRESGFYLTAHRVAYQADYSHRNRERIAEQKRQWLKLNADKHRAATREAMRRRRATAKGKLESNVSRAVHRALRGRKNGEPAFVLLGFKVEELIAHLERQFQRGMTWENYGAWHVDHIRPLASFSYSEPTDPDFKRAWAITNLRPLWATENISKGARVSLLV